MKRARWDVFRKEGRGRFGNKFMVPPVNESV
jgi:hypothetical protein